jgi:hypothetical protein
MDVCVGVHFSREWLRVLPGFRSAAGVLKVCVYLRVCVCSFSVCVCVYECVCVMVVVIRDEEMYIFHFNVCRRLGFCARRLCSDGMPFPTPSTVSTHTHQHTHTLPLSHSDRRSSQRAPTTTPPLSLTHTHTLSLPLSHSDRRSSPRARRWGGWSLSAPYSTCPSWHAPS